jgi:hypothetical protein
MKVTTIRKAGAAALAGAMAFSCASCALFGPNKKEIVEAADTFAGTLLKQDAGKIIKLTTEDEDSDVAEALEMIFDEETLSDDQKKFVDAVSDTITYEVDEESVEINKDEASADVTFTMVDYEKALDGDFEDIDAVLDALDDCEDIKEVEITLEFEKDDDEWLLSNIDDEEFGELFDYYIYELNLTPALSVDYTDIWPGTSGIISEVYFIDDITAYESSLTYDVYFNGSLIDSNLAAVVADTNTIWCDYATELEAGEYEIVVYLDGVELTSMSTTVEETGTTPTVTDDTVSTNDYSYVFTADGQLADLVHAVDWYMDDGYGYYSFNDGIEYDIYFSDALTYDDVVGITFNIYDEDGNTLAEGETVYGSNISYGTNEDGYYYVYLPYQTEDGLASGTYYIEVFNPDGTTLMTDSCVVE